MLKADSLHDAHLPADITVGLVLHLDPDCLQLHGATCSCAPAFRVQGQHFFVCIDATPGQTRWLPLFSRPGPGRLMLASAGASGHPKWSRGVYYYHPAQVWTAAGAAIAEAAARAHDKSRRGARNSMAPEHVPNL